MAEKKPNPNEIVRARRRKGYGDVSILNHVSSRGDDVVREGEIIEMRRSEAEFREDFHVVGEADTTADPPVEEEGN